jgi:hypothetical protein
VLSFIYDQKVSAKLPEDVMPSTLNQDIMLFWNVHVVDANTEAIARPLGGLEE